MRTCKIKKTQKQKEAIRLIKKNTTTLLEGGSRSGKTFIALYTMVVRAMKYEFPTQQLVARFRFAHAKMAICFQTMPKVLRAMQLEGAVHLNRSDWYYSFPNGSTIWVGGLDDKERAEKILGNEFDTIFLNEASQISYDVAEILRTRLNAQQGVEPRFLIDYNPPSVHHWGYKIFHLREYPDGRPVSENDFAWIKMNPHDNKEHLSDSYIEILEQLSAGKRKRFLEGDYTEDLGSLWKRSWIKYGSAETYERIVVAVDPTGSVQGDEAGIIVTGRNAGKYYVLDDYSLHGTPQEWASEAVTAYRKWEADIMIAEKNYGGDMVESTIKNVDKSVNVKLVTATRGKIVRAEPISALYEQGLVYHRIPFLELEDEYCMYEQGSPQSPNRLDASVWGLLELSGVKIGAFIGRA